MKNCKIGMFIVIFMVVLNSCGSEIDLTAFTPYAPEKYQKYIDTLESYYGRPLPSIHNIEWYYGQPEDVINLCDINNFVAACVFTRGLVVVRECRVNACHIELHEMLHLALRDMYGETDKDHSRSMDWKNVFYLCDDIKSGI